MKRLIWLPVAGFLLIAGAAVAAAAPGLADTAKDLLGTNQAEGATASGAPSDGSGSEPVTGLGLGLGLKGDHESLLDEVLADLVTSGVITQEQSDAITSALTTRAEERRAEFEAQREQMQQMWTQIKGFLEDGVISADEIAQLPADNPFTNLSEILADGQITTEELQSIRPFGGFFLDGPGHHRGPGGHGPGWFTAPEDDSSTDSTTDSSSSSDANS